MRNCDLVVALFNKYLHEIAFVWENLGSDSTERLSKLNCSK